MGDKQIWDSENAAWESLERANHKLARPRKGWIFGGHRKRYPILVNLPVIFFWHHAGQKICRSGLALHLAWPPTATAQWVGRVINFLLLSVCVRATSVPLTRTHPLCILKENVKSMHSVCFWKRHPLCKTLYNKNTLRCRPRSSTFPSVLKDKTAHPHDANELLHHHTLALFVIILRKSIQNNSYKYPKTVQVLSRCPLWPGQDKKKSVFHLHITSCTLQIY